MVGVVNVILKMRFKGQMTVVGLLMLFISLLVYALVVAPVLNDVLAQATPSMDSTTAMIMNMTPWLIPIMIILSFFWYVIPNREYYPYR